MSVTSTHARGRSAPGIQRTKCGTIISPRIPLAPDPESVTCGRCRRSLQRVAPTA